MNTRTEGLLKAARYFLLFACIILVGCAFRIEPADMSQIEVGMSKADVIKILGTPHDYKGKGNTLYLIYNAIFGVYGEREKVVSSRSRYVKLTDGKVESFGAVGDFDSTKDPTLNLNIKNR